jgi:hypothetical protein
MATCELARSSTKLVCSLRVQFAIICDFTRFYSVYAAVRSRVAGFISCQLVLSSSTNLIIGLHSGVPLQARKVHTVAISPVNC